MIQMKHTLSVVKVQVKKTIPIENAHTIIYKWKYFIQKSSLKKKHKQKSRGNVLNVKHFGPLHKIYVEQSPE